MMDKNMSINHFIYALFHPNTLAIDHNYPDGTNLN